MHFSVEHVGLPARDPRRLMEWYVNILGAQLRYKDGQTPPAFFVALPDGLMLEIYQATGSLPETSDNKLGGWRHLALHVDCLETAKAELEQRGLKFTESIKPAGGGGRVLFFQDAEGNLLHLVERPADSPLKKLE
ncbi:MAG TPA: VOC family protein [Verrucomicrobiae bacterium]|nr:VOC family protein [Verrucomicrobiae bacterium]